MVMRWVQHRPNPSTGAPVDWMPVIISSTVSPGDAPEIVHSSMPPPAGTTCEAGAMVMPGVSDSSSTVCPAISGPIGSR